MGFNSAFKGLKKMLNSNLIKRLWSDWFLDLLQNIYSHLADTQFGKRCCRFYLLWPYKLSILPTLCNGFLRFLI